MQEQLFLTAKDTLGYAEEHIIINGTNKLKKYSLSNRLDDIEQAIFARTSQLINLDNAYWSCEPTGPSISVKHLMSIRKVNYSMTVTDDEGCSWIAIYMRADDKWLYTFINRYP